MTRSIGGAKQWTMCTSWISVNLLCAQILKHHSAMESVTFLRISGLVTDTKSKYPRETVVWHRGESGRTIVAKWHIKDKTGYQAWIMTVKQSCKNMKTWEYYSHLLITPPPPPLLTLVQRCSFCNSAVQLLDSSKDICTCSLEHNSLYVLVRVRLVQWQLWLWPVLINRLGVAGAVLQRHSWLIN